jgi:rubrerythrin
MTVPTRKTRLFTRREVDRGDFIDKLAQRWVVERAAVTMYQEAIARLRVNQLLQKVIPELERFMAQEKLHADMLEQLLGELGRGDVHGEHATPAVNLAASTMAAILESIRAPRATARSIMEAILMAERVDAGGWELLTELAKEGGLDEDYLRSFRAAEREEREHEHVVRTHLMRLEHEMLLHERYPVATSR